MSLKTKVLTFGSLKLSVYTFEKEGDVLPMHVHDDKTVHISIVARGECLMSGGGFKDIHAKSGAIVDWEPGVHHEFRASKDNTVLINIPKNI